MVCHGEIVARRPAPRFLTRFYLMISLGGAAGGMFVGVVAPLAFPAHFEMPIALCGVALAIYFTAPGKLRFAGALSLLAAAGMTTAQVRSTLANTVARSRNFYGALRVTRTSPADAAASTLRLSHGVILHGEQYVSRERRASPTSYYGPASGIGRSIALLRPAPIRMGIVGLGTGTLAAYGRAGDYLKFYELDPEVERYARSLFHFLEDSPANIEVAIGDARLTLEREPPQGYDVIVVDAFSSDSIPVHLMTREAMEVYRRHLREGGLVAFHVSNRYLDLAPIVGGLADVTGMRAYQLRDEPADRSVLAPSLWVIVTRNDALIERFATERLGEIVRRRDDLRLWTDDYSNLLDVVQFRHAGEAT
jgi:SAM-dependent methyltransferase